jgi:outer membrane murein-binding lipoprotein Lpp
MQVAKLKSEADYARSQVYVAEVAAAHLEEDLASLRADVECAHFFNAQASQEFAAELEAARRALNCDRCAAGGLCGQMCSCEVH